MNTTKKLLVLVMVALMAAVSVMPSTFSWYNHSASLEGQSIKYTRKKLPVSMKTASDTVSMETVESDKDNIKSSTTANNVSLGQGQVQYYTTTLTNTGSNPVYVDLNMKNLVNNADFYIGTLIPTINEKAYASRPVRTKKATTTTRVYFKTYPGDNNNNWDFWHEDNGSLTPESSAAAGSNSTTNDINIAYKMAGNANEQMKKMNKCDNSDDGSNRLGNDSTNVYYYDIPSDAEYFYFFNHWYLKSATNREWNRTIDITDTSTNGVLYYLTGGSVSGDEGYKEYKSVTNTSLAALNSYYDTVRMSMGSNVHASIGLKKSSDDPEFVPEYYGNSIGYKVKTANSDPSPNYISVDPMDGIITPKQSTPNNSYATIITTVTGKFGDKIEAETKVTIPTYIAEVPILQNILVPHSGAVDSQGNALSNKVEIHWYAKNTSSDKTMTTDNIFITV